MNFTRDLSGLDTGEVRALDKDQMDKLAMLRAENVFGELASRPEGLTQQEAASRLLEYGPNQLPRAAALSLRKLFLKQS